MDMNLSDHEHWAKIRAQRITHQDETPKLIIPLLMPNIPCEMVGMFLSTNEAIYFDDKTRPEVVRVSLRDFDGFTSGVKKDPAQCFIWNKGANCLFYRIDLFAGTDLARDTSTMIPFMLPIEMHPMNASKRTFIKSTQYSWDSIQERIVSNAEFCNMLGGAAKIIKKLDLQSLSDGSATLPLSTGRYGLDWTRSMQGVWGIIGEPFRYRYSKKIHLEDFPVTSRPVLRLLQLTLEYQEIFNDVKRLKFLKLVGLVSQGSNYSALQEEIIELTDSQKLRERFAGIWKNNRLEGFDDYSLAAMTESIDDLKTQLARLHSEN